METQLTTLTASNDTLEFNEELLLKVVDHAISAENWNQHEWIAKSDKFDCGTTACVAGFAALTAGWKPVFVQSSLLTSWSDESCNCGECRGVTTNIVERDGVRLSVFEAARKVLGLTIFEADTMFESHNDTPTTLRTAAQAIIERRRTAHDTRPDVT